ncbi:MAG: (Fe-S)-binding protein [Gammaproteobacteria bacterium]|nr:(Fe-S)-binding protein [Gammaproteobacteria bacterium]
MCLPHCPTYHLTRDESESPRGRIALIQGLTGGQLAYSDKLETHLENCLKCRACERVCPSLVPYGELIDGALTHIAREVAPQSARRLRLLNFVTQPATLRTLAKLLRVYQRSGLRALLRGSGLLKVLGLARQDRLLPSLHTVHPWQAYYPAQNTPRGDVALFTGCIADAFDQATSRAAIQVLTQLGYGVHVPPGQRCCGALHLHNQQPEQASALAQENLAAFGGLDVQAIINTASGCGATLKEYLALNPGADSFTRKVVDISTFIASVPWPENVMLKPLKARVAVHDPCSLTHVLRQHEAPYAMLRKIPEIELGSLPDRARCCGAAGSYMLTHPTQADALRDEKLSNIEQLDTRILVTSNIGCALHLAAGLREKHLSIEVMHQTTLLARQVIQAH